MPESDYERPPEGPSWDDMKLIAAVLLAVLLLVCVWYWGK